MSNRWRRILGCAIWGLLVVTPLAAENVEPGKAGEVAADTEFRPKPNGFRFENWGGGELPQGGLTADDTRCLFGDQVCARFEQGKCVPTPAAKVWIAAMNKMMAGGHCEGMAALSSALFTGHEKAQDYGAKSAFEIDTSNVQALRTISTYFVTQAIEPVASKTQKTRAMSLTEIVATLAKAMQTRTEGYTLGIYGADGGHAITPYAVEDLGKGRYWIHVYDNNYPGVSNHIEIDLNADTWSYAGAALNPAQKAAPWTGNSGSMDLTPLAWRLEPLLCPFCDDPQPVQQLQGCLAKKTPASPKKPAVKSPQKPSAKSPKKPSVRDVGETILVYTDADCDGLSITDKKTKKQLRSQNNALVNEIPGAFLMTLRGTPGCYAQLPASGDYEFSIGGVAEQAAKPVAVTFTRPGMVYSVSDLNVSASDQDVFSINNATFTYTPGEDSQATITVATDDQEGADELYVISDLTLQDGYSFTIGENDEGQFILSSDDPDQEPFDIETTISDEDGDEEYEREDVDLPDTGETVFEIDDDASDDEADDDASDDDADDDASDDASDDDASDDDSGSDDSGDEGGSEE